MLRKLCANCLEHTPVELVTISTKEEIQDEVVTFNAKYYQCTQCDEVIPNNDLENENYKTMYRKFKEKKNMLQSDEIKYIREEVYQVSTRLMAKLIGCSPATLSRYENGAIQSKQHDNQLKMLRDPRNMKTLFNSSVDDIPEGKDKQDLKNRLDFLIEVLKSSELLKGFDDELKLLDFKQEQTWNEVNVEEVEKFFIIKGQEFEDDEEELRVSPLKLQKMLYYAQGWTIAFTENTLFSDDFQAWQHGPVIPTIYHKYKEFGSRRIYENFGHIENLNFTHNQFKILEWVWDKYSKYEAKFLENLTHMEHPWRITRADLPAEASCNWKIEKDDIQQFFCSMYKTLKLLQKA